MAERSLQLRSHARRLALVAFFAGALGCAPRRPPFVEPDWGDAPPPYPAEVTEVTREYRHCARDCRFERLVFRRDGEVTRRFMTGKHVDSLFTARIDSTAFVAMVHSLTALGFFRPMEGAGEHVPLAVDSYLISAATLCRRAVATYSPLAFDLYPTDRAVLVIERAMASLRWSRCCPPGIAVSARTMGPRPGRSP